MLSLQHPPAFTALETQGVSLVCRVASVTRARGCVCVCVCMYAEGRGRGSRPGKRARGARPGTCWTELEGCGSRMCLGQAFLGPMLEHMDRACSAAFNCGVITESFTRTAEDDRRGPGGPSVSAWALRPRAAGGAGRRRTRTPLIDLATGGAPDIRCRRSGPLLRPLPEVRRGSPLGR